MRWWRWCVVSALPMPVSNMPPAPPGQPQPVHFRQKNKTMVVVYHRKRYFRNALYWARIVKNQLRAVGCVREATEVQVWSREILERMPRDQVRNFGQ